MTTGKEDVMIRSNQIHSLDASKVITSNERTFVTNEQLEKLIKLKQSVEIYSSESLLPHEGDNEVLYIVITELGGDIYIFDGAYKKINTSLADNIEFGDMLKSIYDTNNNGIVDKAEMLVGCKLTPAQINGFYDEFKGYIDKIDNEELPKLEKAILDIENQAQDITAIQGAIADHDGRLNALDLKTNELNTNIEQVKTSTDNRLASLEEDSHKHANADVLNLLSDKEGSLQYKGIDLIASGAGDMKKEVYDTNDNGVVDKAETLEGLTVTVADINKVSEIDGLIEKVSTVSEQANELATKTHNHDNEEVLKKLSELNGILQYDGKDITGVDTENQSQVKVFQTNAMFPLVSEEDIFYVALDNNGTGLPCIYIGKNSGYVNLYDGIGQDSNGSSGNGSGDMLRSIYDKDKNGIVDQASTLVGLELTPAQLNTLAKTVEQLQILLNNTVTSKLNSLQNTADILMMAKHSHNNAQVLSELKEQNGSLYYKDVNITSPELNFEGLGDMKKSTYDSDGDGIVDKAKTLDGLMATTQELNYLTGAKSNIQEQLTALTVGYSIKGTVATYAKLTALDLSSITAGDAYIVEADETKGGQKTNYVRGTNEWVYLGLFEIKTRDFETNPINLATETSGMIQDEKIPTTVARVSQLHTHTIAEDKIKDAIDKTHIHSNLSLLESIMINESDEVFIGDHRISCNVEFYPNNDYLPVVGAQDVLYIVKSDETNSGNSAFYIYLNGAYQRVLNDFIEGPGVGQTNGILNQITKLNVVAPKEVKIQIKETVDFNLPDINVLKFKPGQQDVVSSMCDFDNADKGDFEENSNIIFDGTMKIKTGFEIDMTKEEDLFKATLNKAGLNITKIEVI